MRALAGRLAVAAGVLVGVAATAAHAADCTPRLEVYEGYVIRRVHAEGPFPLVRAFDRALASVTPDLPAPGSILRADDVEETRRRLEDRVRALPSLVDLPVSITASGVSIENCDDRTRELDLIFWVFTTRLSVPSLVLGGSADRMREDPAGVANVVAPGPRLSLAPEVRFNESDRLVGGARAAFLHPASNTRVAADAAASDRYATGAIGVEATREVESPLLWRASFGGGYRFEEQPVGGEETRRGVGFGWLAGLTRPLSPHVVRYAAQIEDGFHDSSLRSPGFAADTHYRALKLLGGVSGTAARGSYSLNVGGELGATTATVPAWYTVVIDAAHSVRLAPHIALFDHLALDLDGRLLGGWLEPVGQGRAPAGERFFGGVRPRLFTEVPDWPVHAAPVIRGYPANRFYAQLGGDPSGRERFLSVNLTAAFTAWRRPLLPKEIYTNEAFLAAIAKQKGTARASLQGYHESHDPALAGVEPLAAEIDDILAAMEGLLRGRTVPETVADALEICQDTLDQARSSLRKARQQRMFRTLVSPNVPPPPGSLGAVARDCEIDLNGTLDDAALHASAARLRQRGTAIEEIVTTRVDRRAVARRVDEDFALVDRALDAFIYDINLVSIDPVLIYDVAYAGPSVRDAFVRHSVGGGLRLTLGSTVSFTLGYAANPNRGRGEPAGAVFFDMKVNDILR